MTFSESKLRLNYTLLCQILICTERAKNLELPLPHGTIVGDKISFELRSVVRPLNSSFLNHSFNRCISYRLDTTADTVY